MTDDITALYLGGDGQNETIHGQRLLIGYGDSQAFIPRLCRTYADY